jgi:hypothetical protein
MVKAREVFSNQHLNTIEKGETMKKILTSMVLVLALAAGSTTVFAANLKWPYLIYPGQQGAMEVLWQDTTTETTNTLCWGTDTTYSTGCDTNDVEYSASTHQHMYTISGLQDNTTYYYQVKDATNGVYGSGSFITAPSANATSIRFLGIGDTRSYPYNLDGVMQAMRNFYTQPGNADYQRLVIHNGDWVSSDGESYWTSQWFDSTKTDIVNFTANSPINGCEGNHDTSGSYPNGTSQYFPKYFPFPYLHATHNGTATTFNPAVVQTWANLYWSFDYGPVHFTVVDNYSNVAAGSAQFNFVQADLAASTKPWNILIYHEPAWSAGSDGDNTAVRVFEQFLGPQATNPQNGHYFDLVYNGHSHNYARTGAYSLAGANGDTTIALNVPHFTTGGGGAPVYQPDFTNTGSYPHVITAWPADEFMAFDVEGKTLTINTYQVNGLASYASGSVQSGPLPVTTGISPIEQIVLNHFTNVSSQVTAQVGNIVYNRATRTYNGSVTITNNGPALTGNVDVVLDGMINIQGIGNADNEYSTATPKPTSKIAQNTNLVTNVTLANANGSNNGEPMIRATTTGLANGASVTVPLQFSNPTNAKFTFNPITYQE